MYSYTITVLYRYGTIFFCDEKIEAFKIFVNAKYEKCIRVAALCIPAGLNTNMPSFRDILFFFKE
jgi:hypothetical protein